MAKFIAFVAVLSVTLGHPVAHAESCFFVRDFTVPEAGATDVALDVRVLSWPDPSFPAQLSLASDTEAIPLEETSVGDAVELRPTAPLAPQTTYRVLDVEREISRFTTGSATGGELTPLDLGETLVYQIADCEDDGPCLGNRRFVAIDLVADPDLTAYVVKQGVTQTELTFPAADVLQLDGRRLDTCRFGHVLVAQADGRYCLELSGRRANGQRTPFARACGELQTCAPIGPGDDIACRPAEADDGGCRAAHGDGGWALVLLALVGLRRRRAPADVR